MKKILCLLFLLSPLVAWGAEVANDWAVGTLSVSSRTTTVINATGVANLSGRYLVRIQNPDPTYAVAIGTNSTFAYTAGWIIANSSGTLDLPLNAATTFYGIVAPNATQQNVSLKIIELK